MAQGVHINFIFTPLQTMDCSPVFDAYASFSFLEDGEIRMQLSLINELFSTIDISPHIHELFSTIDNFPPINAVDFVLLDSKHSTHVSLLGATFGLLCRALARITRSRSFQEPIHVVESIDDCASNDSTDADCACMPLRW